MRRLRAAVAFAVAVMAACDDYGSGPDDRDRTLTGGFYGTVEGSEKGNPFTRIVNLHLNEYVGTVTGSFSFVGGYGAGDISGTVSGSTVTFTFAQTAPCAGTFAGSGILAGDRLTGSYSGASCRGAVRASFDVNRVPPVVPL